MSPRLHGYAETKKANYYDAIFDGFGGSSWSALRDGYLNTFNNSNIGIADLTNTQVGGQTTGDQTLYVQNWYARTNIPACDALEEFAQSTIATLCVGYRFVMQLPLSDLLRRSQDVPLPAGVETPDVAVALVDDLARMMNATYQQQMGTAFGFGDHATANGDAWRAAAAATYRHLKGSPMIIVPPRQCFGVRVTPDRAALDKLERDCPSGVEPRPRMWVHLQGFERRDVC